MTGFMIGAGGEVQTPSMTVRLSCAGLLQSQFFAALTIAAYTDLGDVVRVRLASKAAVVVSWCLLCWNMVADCSFRRMHAT